LGTKYPFFSGAWMSFLMSNYAVKLSFLFFLSAFFPPLPAQRQLIYSSFFKSTCLFPSRLRRAVFFDRLSGLLPRSL